MDRRLIERVIEIATQSQAFGSRALRAALDSSPLWGAGRVEDTYNLLGHALRKALSVIARQQGRGLTALTPTKWEKGLPKEQKRRRILSQDLCKAERRSC